jgi:hypothetical protein
MPDLNVPRESPGIVGVDGKLFVVGGRINETDSKTGSVEFYDPDQNVWKLLTENHLHVRNANEEYVALIMD